eukprot:1156717-Pelagomonas_calceolata.AAC.2
MERGPSCSIGSGLCKLEGNSFPSSKNVKEKHQLKKPRASSITKAITEKIVGIWRETRSTCLLDLAVRSDLVSRACLEVAWLCAYSTGWAYSTG